MLPDETDARREITRFLSEQLEEIHREIALALSLLPPGGLVVTRTRDVDRVVVLATLALYAKAIKSARAVALVCEGGLGQDGIALLRVLFETTMGLLFVLQRNSRIRARLYLVHPYAKKVQILRLWRETRGFKRKVTKASIKNAEQPLFDAVRNLTGVRRWPRNEWYGADLPAALVALSSARKRNMGIAVAERSAVEALLRAVKGYGSGRNVEETARTLKWQGAYNTLYRYASGFSHGGDLLDHVEIKPDGSMSVKLIPAADGSVRRTLETASLTLWAASSRINKRLGLGKDAEIEAARPVMASRPRRKHGKHPGNAKH
jgi:hypothetical protein